MKRYKRNRRRNFLNVIISKTCFSRNVDAWLRLRNQFSTDFNRFLMIAIYGSCRRTINIIRKKNQISNMIFYFIFIFCRKIVPFYNIKPFLVIPIVQGHRVGKNGTNLYRIFLLQKQKMFQYIRSIYQKLKVSNSTIPSWYGKCLKT